MGRRYLVVLLALMSVVLLGPVIATVQAQADDAEKRATPSTPWGDPDIQGTFTFRTITPLERPSAFAGQETLDPEEAENFEASENIRVNRDLFDPLSPDYQAGYQPRSEGGVLSYNEFWYERGTELTKDNRTALIVDPPDGRIPYTEEAIKQRRNIPMYLRAETADSYTDRSLADRCIMGFNSGPPMTSGGYNNNVQIWQIPGYVVLLNEMVHNTRIISTDGRPHLNIRQWAGDSRGHWEGNTLVVETTNFLRETSLRGSTADTQLVERFTRIDADTVMYEFTAEDLNSYTRPWTAQMPLRRTDGSLFEYACHEGNYGLYGILAGARAKEKAAEEAKTGAQ